MFLGERKDRKRVGFKMITGIWGVLIYSTAISYCVYISYCKLREYILSNKEIYGEKSVYSLKNIMGEVEGYYRNRSNKHVDHLREIEGKIRDRADQENKREIREGIEISIFKFIVRIENNWVGGNVSEGIERNGIKEDRHRGVEDNELLKKYEELKSKEFFTYRDVDRLMDWINTEKGFNRSQLLLVKYTDTFSRVQNTIEESKELLFTVPIQLQEEVLEVLDEFFYEVGKLKKYEDELREIEEQAIQDSLVNRMEEEKNYVRSSK